jgi:PKD repeat protein
VAGFSGSPRSGEAPLTVSFTDESTGGAPTSWSWTFGDGGAATSENPTHQYANVGTYTVSLTVQNALGQDSETKSDYISVLQPKIVIFLDDFEAQFSGWTTSDLVSWYTGTPKNGTHSVELKRDGAMSRTVSTAGHDAITVTVYMGAKSLDNANEYVQCLWYDGSEWDELARINNGDPHEDGQLHYYQFDLPSSASDNPQFALEFRITASGSGDYMYVDDVTVKGRQAGPPPAPVANFSGNPTSGTAPLTVTFTDLSTNGPTSWSWTFGDGGTGAGQNPSHQYANAGTYTVSLTAANAGGSDSETKSNYITVTAPSQVTIFSDTFESGFTWYEEGNTTWYSGDPKIGTHSVQMKGNECWTHKTISTVGYRDIVFRVCCGAKSYEASEKFYVYWQDGSTNYTLRTIVNGDPEEDGQLHFFEFSLPAGAENISSFGVAFYQTPAGTGDYAYIDSVEVLGAPM